VSKRATKKAETRRKVKLPRFDIKDFDPTGIDIPPELADSSRLLAKLDPVGTAKKKGLGKLVAESMEEFLRDPGKAKVSTRAYVRIPKDYLDDLETLACHIIRTPAGLTKVVSTPGSVAAYDAVRSAIVAKFPAKHLKPRKRGGGG
jgi:hypothetical protein